MDKKTLSSIKQFAISFLIIDLAFWLLVSGTCIFSAEDCVDTATFLPFFFYQPWTYILASTNIPFFSQITSYGLLLTLSAVILSTVHVLTGALLGLLLRKQKVSNPIAILISATILIVTATFFTYQSFEEELEDSTRTQLWEVTNANSGSVEFKETEWIEDKNSPNGFQLVADAGVTTNYYENFDNTEVILLKSADPSPESAVTVSYAEYLAARAACKAGPCDYYGIGGEFDLFEVTYNSQEILKMEAKYIP